MTLIVTNHSHAHAIHHAAFNALIRTLHPQMKFHGTVIYGASDLPRARRPRPWFRMSLKVETHPDAPMAPEAPLCMTATSQSGAVRVLPYTTLT